MSAGFTLVEVALALGITAFCLVALMGMIPVGLTNSLNASTQTGAASLLTAVAADLRDTPLPTATVPNPVSPFFQIPVPTPAPSPATGTSAATAPTVFYMDDGGSFNAVLAALPNARYRVTVTNLPTSTGASTPIYSTTEQLVVTWPPQTSVSSAAGSMAAIVELNRN
jgi:Tfp pilus assembly protein PilV